MPAEEKDEKEKMMTKQEQQEGDLEAEERRKRDRLKQIAKRDPEEKRQRASLLKSKKASKTSGVFKQETKDGDSVMKDSKQQQESLNTKNTNTKKAVKKEEEEKKSSPSNTNNPSNQPQDPHHHHQSRRRSSGGGGSSSRSPHHHRRGRSPPPPYDRRRSHSSSSRNQDYHHRRHSSGDERRRYSGGSGPHPYHRHQHHRGGGGGGDPYHHHNGGGGPQHYDNNRFNNGEVDDFGRQARHNHHQQRSYSRSRSRGRSRSRSARSRSRSVSSSASSAYSSSSSSSSGSGSSASSSNSSTSSHNGQDNTYTKDQRTVFVTQLVLRTTESDLYRYFKKQGIRVNDITFLRDRNSSSKHKGSAYVELRHMADVNKAVTELSNQPPDFQRFPILIKASEAEKNYVHGNTSTASTSNGGNIGAAAKVPKVYVGNLDINLVTAQHIQTLFGALGPLESVTLTPGKGYGFLQYADVKSACLALQTMAGQVLAGRPIKTGWAQQSAPAVIEFPPDAAERVQNAYKVLAQLTGAAPTTAVPVPMVMPPSVVAATAATAQSSSRVPTVADARASLAAAAATPAHVAPIVAAAAAPPPLPLLATKTGDDPTKIIGNADHPTRTVLVHNMYDKDQETEEGWETEIRDEFQEECSKYGTIQSVVVASRQVGGKIYASFQDVSSAQTCASSLAGRWFDKRQLSVEFVSDDVVAAVQQEYNNQSSS